LRLIIRYALKTCREWRCTPRVLHLRTRWSVSYPSSLLQERALGVSWTGSRVGPELIWTMLYNVKDKISILTALCDLSRRSVIITDVVHSQLTSARNSAWSNCIYKACPPFKDLGVVIIAPPSHVTYRAAQWPTSKSPVPDQLADQTATGGKRKSGNRIIKYRFQLF